MRFLRVLFFMMLVVLYVSGFSAVDIEVQGHRGCRGLMPENSMPAFEHAIELGVDTIELDTVMTSDMVVVIYHDTFLNPERVRRNGEFITDRILIKDLSFTDLREYDIGRIADPEKWPEQAQMDGVKIPSLEEVIELVKQHNESSAKKVGLNIEIKASPEKPDETMDLYEHVRTVVELINRHAIEDLVTVQSFYWKALRIVKELDDSIATAALVSTTNLDRISWTDGLRLRNFGFDIGKMIANLGADIISPNYTLMTDGWISSAHNSNLKIIPWTVNEESEMRRLMNLKVDGIITDYPDRLLAILAEVRD